MVAVTIATIAPTPGGLGALESKLADAATKTGDEATRAYREVQHDLQSFARNADDVMRDVAHDVEDAEQTAWSDLKSGYHTVAAKIDHIIDRLF